MFSLTYKLFLGFKNWNCGSKHHIYQIFFYRFLSFVFLILSPKYKKYMFYNLKPRLIAKVYLKQKIFTLEGVKMITFSDRQPLCCQKTFYKQFIWMYKLIINNYTILRNTQTLGHNPVNHPFPNEKGWQIVDCANSNDKKLKF